MGGPVMVQCGYPHEKHPLEVGNSETTEREATPIPVAAILRPATQQPATKADSSTCPFCHQKVGILSREHPECRRAHQAGWHEMVQLAAQAAGSPDFDESHLRLTLSAVAKISYGNEDTVSQALEEGWKIGVDHSMADGIITQDEEAQLRKLRDQLALGSDTADPDAIEKLDRASRDRLMLDARLAAIAVFDGGAHLESLTETLKQSTLYKDEQSMLLVQACEAAVEGALEDGLFTLDEENALTRYINHFNLRQSQLDAHGVHTSLIKAAILREIAEGVVPDRQHLSGNAPFNLMKSGKLVWVMDDVDYIGTIVRRERRGSSHGLSIRIARGVYHRPVPSEAVQSNGRKPCTRTQDYSGSPPSTSTSRDPRRSSGCATTGSWTSNPTTTASA